MKDVHLGVLQTMTVFNALRLEEMTKGMSIDREENRAIQSTELWGTQLLCVWRREGGVCRGD